MKFILTSLFAFTVLFLSQTECMDRKHNNSCKSPNNSKIVLPLPVQPKRKDDSFFKQNGKCKIPVAKR